MQSAVRSAGPRSGCGTTGRNSIFALRGIRSAAYLSSLDADERPIKGVHINDEKAMFLFRWYQEMDKNGKILSGYQNKECKAFYLPLDNGGYGFRLNG